jgi:hypothetical protein
MQNPLRGVTKIALAAGTLIEKHKMRKYFDLIIADASFSLAHKTDAIAAETATDRIYVMRTSLSREFLDDAPAMRSCKTPSGLVWTCHRRLTDVETYLARLGQNWAQESGQAPPGLVSPE